MDPIERQERKREARRRLRAQRRRAGELRGRVLAVSLIAFVGLWGVVFVQMATGNDPVLGSGPPPRRSPRSSDPRHRSRARPEPRPTPALEAPEPEPEPAPVTTSQS